MWKALHSRWTVLLQLECSMSQWTLCGRYCTTGGEWYWSLNGVCYREHYVVEVIAQQVNDGIGAWMECVTVNIMWKVLHSRWTVVLQFECRVLQWTVCGRYCTAGGQWYWSLNGVCYSEHYVEGTVQQVDSGTAGWMECVTINNMWKVLHSRWTVLLQVEWSVLQWTLCGRYWTAGGQRHCILIGVCYNEHYVEGTSQQVDSDTAGWSVLQWTLCGRYLTAGGQWYCRLNGVCYSEHYVEGTAQQVDSFTAGWMEFVTVNIVWKVLHSMFTVVLQVEWSVLQFTLCGGYCTAGGQWYCT